MGVIETAVAWQTFEGLSSNRKQEVIRQLIG